MNKRKVASYAPPLVAAALLFACSLSGFAQNFNGDARNIGMGSVGSQKNMAADFAGETGDSEAEAYRAIPIPLGLFQVLRKTEIFDPSDEDFNPVRAIEYASNPIHFTFGRDRDDAGERLVNDLVNGRINRDLTAYRGFTPPSDTSVQGLLDSSWGKTFKLMDNGGAPLHGIYVGAGPYVSIGTNVRFDQTLLDVFSGSAGAPANSTFRITDTTDGQAAAALTAGYRVRVPLPGLQTAGGGDAGAVFAVNYNYLYGLHYDSADLAVQFDTGNDGLLTLQPSTLPLGINRVMSTTGRGFSVDLASALMIDRWVFGFAANGVGNRITWKELRAETFELTSLLDDLEFVETDVAPPAAERRIKLPVRYSGSAAYEADRWTVKTEAAEGLQDFEFHGGLEYRMGPVSLRGGSRFVRDLWHPAGGIGLNLTDGFGIDAAVMTTANNIEEERRVSLAVSLRFRR